MLQYIINNLKEAIHTYLIKNLSGTIGYDIRYAYYRRKLLYCGSDVIIKPNVLITNPQRIILAKGANIGAGCYLMGDNDIYIGENTLIAMDVKILTSNHTCKKKDIAITNQGNETKPIHIGNDCWIGANVIILPGITIENGCVIGAGSVVTKNIPEYSIAIGNPAKVIKKR